MPVDAIKYGPSRRGQIHRRRRPDLDWYRVCPWAAQGVDVHGDSGCRRCVVAVGFRADLERVAARRCGDSVAAGDPPGETHRGTGLSQHRPHDTGQGKTDHRVELLAVEEVLQLVGNPALTATTDGGVVVVAGKVGTTAGAGGLRREQPPATNTIAAHHTTATDRMPPRVSALPASPPGDRGPVRKVCGTLHAPFPGKVSVTGREPRGPGLLRVFERRLVTGIRITAPKCATPPPKTTTPAPGMTTTTGSGAGGPGAGGPGAGGPGTGGPVLVRVPEVPVLGFRVREVRVRGARWRGFLPGRSRPVTAAQAECAVSRVG